VGGSSAVSDLLRVRGWAANRNEALFAADGGRPSPPESLFKTREDEEGWVLAVVIGSARGKRNGVFCLE
jgi:hypothetical protein